MSGFLEELLGEKLVTGGGEEVDVHSLSARGISLLGLYFGCSLSAPCAQLSASLAAFYGRLRGDAAAGPGAGAGPGPGAGAAAEPEPRRRLEIVFVSSDQDQRQWQDFVRDMPWLALPYKEKHRKLKLWNKYRISNIPSLIFLDATTGKVVCRNGLLVIRDDPEGLEFPWGPKPFREVIAGPLLRNNGQSLESSSLEGSHVGVYFSAHWCPPCRSLTRVLVESYRKIKEAGQKFEIIFVSADRSEDSFKQYFSEMPWLAVPYTDEARRSRLNRLYGIQGIPTLIVLDPQGEVITRQGRVEVLNDEDCREFPWHPKPVLELSDSNAVQLNEGPCLVLFVGGVLGAAAGLPFLAAPNRQLGRIEQLLYEIHHTLCSGTCCSATTPSKFGSEDDGPEAAIPASVRQIWASVQHPALFSGGLVWRQYVDLGGFLSKLLAGWSCA
ncbi:nucleoredoxin isoform X3 [Artibeus jamaicensis]|uniref:nucleoredoxin isoform X3 n=1 Tax=Artibeus jamaicensis TaxID=9417 RepID=UPI00235AE013|nr:nucleoredoxin isoform X3 [Artibeus jamaicensis]